MGGSDGWPELNRSTGLGPSVRSLLSPPPGGRGYVTSCRVPRGRARVESFWEGLALPGPKPFSSLPWVLHQEQASLGQGGRGFSLAEPRALNSASILCRRGLKGLAPKCVACLHSGWDEPRDPFPAPPPT